MMTISFKSLEIMQKESFYRILQALVWFSQYDRK